MAPALFAPPRDLVLRPTDLDPGLYETNAGPVVVSKGPGEGNYLLLWDAAPEPGDIVFRGAYLADVKTEYEASDSVFFGEVVFK